jgi:hypothetical protein
MKLVRKLGLVSRNIVVSHRSRTSDSRRSGTPLECVIDSHDSHLSASGREEKESETPTVDEFKATFWARVIERAAPVVSMSTFGRNCSHRLTYSYCLDEGPEGVVYVISNWKSTRCRD